MIRSAYSKLRAEGLGGLLSAAYRRAIPDRLRYFPNCRPLIESRSGLEIGGPSEIFGRRGCIPIYPIAARIDNCNFGRATVWEGEIEEGETFRFRGEESPGRQFITEASDLRAIADSQYDFVLSSHCLEHLANPLQGLKEWIRVLNAGGLLVLVLPHKDGTFDHRRPVTSMEHLIQDFDAQTTERDLTHLDEILRLHDLARDPGAGDIDKFRERSLKNFENRCLHHHVFDTRLAIEVVDHVQLQILAVELFRPCHIVVIASKPARGQVPDNLRFKGMDGAQSWTSPFSSDQC